MSYSNYKNTDPDTSFEAQELFTRMWFGVRQQGRCSMHAAASVCAYRGRDGAECAVGQVLPDELYWTGLEGGLTQLVHKLEIDNRPGAKAFAAVVRKHQTLFTSCQLAHDKLKNTTGTIFADAYEQEMNDVAKRFGLRPLPKGAKFDSLAAIVAERIAAEQQDTDWDPDAQKVIDLLQKPTPFLALLVKHEACSAGLLGVDRQTAKQFWNSTDRADWMVWLLDMLCDEYAELWDHTKISPRHRTADEIRAEYPWTRVRELNAKREAKRNPE